MTDEGDTHRCINGVSPESCPLLVENSIPTQRAEVHKARGGGSPEVLGVNDVATIELEETTLATWTNERNARQETYHEAIGQPIV